MRSSRSYDRARWLLNLIADHGEVPAALPTAIARYDAANEHESTVPERDLVDALRAADPARQADVIAEWAERRRRADAFSSAVRAGLWSALDADLTAAVDENLPQIRASLAMAVGRAEAALRNAAEVVVGVMEAVPGTSQAAALFRADSAAEVLMTYGEVWPDMHLRLTGHRYTPPGLDLAKFASTPEPGVLNVSARTLRPVSPEQAERCELVREVCHEFAIAPARTLVRITRGEFAGCELGWAENPDNLFRRADALASAHESRRVNEAPVTVGT